jgi:transformation/transcription domain-associated protein
MAQRLRLVSEPAGRRSLEDAYRDACNGRACDPSDLSTRFNDEIAKAMNALSLGDVPKDELQTKETEARLDVFRKTEAHAAGESTLLLKHVQKLLGTPELVYNFRRTFTQQWAANCLLQYAFCVADRTPGRVVLVMSTTGGVLSPEFRVSYNSQGYMESQLIPFRLTANLLNLIGFPLLDGHFVPSMAMVAGAVREHKSDLFYALRLLARDDLIAFYTRSMPKSDSKTQEMERQLADRVVKNAATILSRIVECAPRGRATRDDAATSETDPVDKRVRDLVDASRSAEKLCQMPSSFQGWL